MEIKITRAQTLKEKPDSSHLVFGTNMTDHMFIADYDEGQGWHDPRIVPYGPLPIDPAAKVLHYAEEIFEGLKAYRTADGSIQLFRPWDNIDRLNKSAETDAELKKMWETCMAYDPKWANYFRKRTPLLFVSVPGRVGQEFAGSFYRFANNVVRFN